MEITVTLDDDLLRQAEKETGIQDKTELLQAGLRTILLQAASRRLASLGGSQPDLKFIPRRRFRSEN